MTALQLLPWSFWVIMSLVVILFSLVLLILGHLFNKTFEDFFNTLWVKQGTKHFIRGTYNILDQFDNDEKAMEEIKQLYKGTVKSFSILKKEDATTARDMIDFLIDRLDTKSEAEFEKAFSISEARRMRKRLSGIRDMLHQEFRYPYVEGEQAYLFEALGESIETNNRSKAEERLQELANVVVEDRRVYQKRSENSFRWTIFSAIVGFISLLITILSLVIKIK